MQTMISVGIVQSVVSVGIVQTVISVRTETSCKQ